MRRLYHMESVAHCLLLIVMICLLEGSVIDTCGDITKTQTCTINHERFADRLLNEGDYYRAITEYKRVIFYSSKDYELAGYAAYRIGLCYFYSNRWDDAQTWFFNVAKSSDLSEQLRKHAQLQIARCYQHKSNFIWAGFELDDLYRRHKEKDILRQRILFWKGWNHLELGQWNLANSSFRKLCEEFPMGEVYPIAENLGKAAITGKALPKRSPKLAVRLSTFLPGVGQIYSGKLVKGVTSAVINGGLIYLIIRAVKKREYLNAAGLILLELRFYQGNRYTAMMDAQEYNEGVVEQYLKSLRRNIDTWRDHFKPVLLRPGLRMRPGVGLRH